MYSSLSRSCVSYGYVSIIGHVSITSSQLNVLVTGNTELSDIGLLQVMCQSLICVNCRPCVNQGPVLPLSVTDYPCLICGLFENVYGLSFVKSSVSSRLSVSTTSLLCYITSLYPVDSWLSFGAFTFDLQYVGLKVCFTLHTSKPSESALNIYV